MVEEILYLDGHRIELQSNTIKRTIQINELGELKDRDANYSSTFKIPRTPSNVKVLDMLGVTGNISRKPYIKIPCKYVVDGIELVPFGSAVIKSLNEDISAVIYDGNISIADALSNKELNELDYSEHNHELSIVSYIDSFTNTSGYIYANARYYDVGEDTPFIDEVDQYIDLKSPSFYIHTLFDMIITQAGYTWSGDIQQDADFNSRLTSMAIGYDRTIQGSEQNGNTEIFNQNLTDSYSINSTNPSYVDENVLYSLNTNEGFYPIDISGTTTLNAGESLRLTIMLNSVVIESFFLSDGAFSFNFNIPTEQADTLEVVLIGELEDTGVGGQRVLNYDYDIDLIVNYNTDGTGGKYVQINFEEIIGEEKQIDFVKDVMQRYGLIFQKRAFENHLDFIKIETLLNDRVNSIDWSDKFIGVQSVDYRPNYAKFNFANYKYDSDVEAFANGTLKIDNENLPFSKDLFTSLFLASSIVFNDNNVNNRLFQLFLWLYTITIEEDENENEITTTTIEPTEDKLRFFKLIYRNETHLYKFSDETNAQTFDGNVPTLEFDSDVYYQSYIDTYYNRLNDVLDEYRLFTVQLNLNLIDIFNLNLLRLYYIDKLSGYFYINKISNHTAGRLTKVELIKVE